MPSLHSALSFTEDDLHANRAGYLSAAQRKRYAPPQFQPVVMIAILGHLVFVGGLLGVIALLTGAAAMWIVLLVVLGLGALPFILLRNEGNIRPALRGDVARNNVHVACGIAVLEEKRGRRPYVELTVDGITVQLQPQQARFFVPGADYCIYYLPNSRTLLSAEPYDE